MTTLDPRALTRPIIGIENRTAQEVFDIMSDRFRATLSQPQEGGPSETTAHRVVTDEQKRDMPDAVRHSFNIPLYASPHPAGVVGALKSKIRATLRDYRQIEVADEDNNGYPLVDALNLHQASLSHPAPDRAVEALLEALGRKDAALQEIAEDAKASAAYWNGPQQPSFLRLEEHARSALTASAPATGDGWREQPWMGNEARAKARWDTHDEAMNIVLSAGSVTTLSYEEAALIYARARGFVIDDAELMGSPLPAAPTATGGRG